MEACAVVHGAANSRPSMMVAAAWAVDMPGMVDNVFFVV